VIKLQSRAIALAGGKRWHKKLPSDPRLEKGTTVQLVDGGSMLVVQAVTYCLQGDIRYYHFFTDLPFSEEEQTNLRSEGWVQK